MVQADWSPERHIVCYWDIKNTQDTNWDLHVATALHDCFGGFLGDAAECLS